MSTVTNGLVASSISCIGDSLTDFRGFYGVSPTQTWPSVMEASLRAAGRNVRCRNFGIGGNTTNQNLARVIQLTFREVPKVAFIFCGVNDPGSATTVNGSGATTTTVPVQSGKGAALVGGYVTINGQNALVQSQASDTLTLATALSAAPASGAAVTIPTQLNLQAMINAVVTAGCSNIVINSAHYLNFTTGGDTQGADYAAYVPVRAAQAAVVAANPATTVFNDLHAQFSARIAGGLDTQGSNSWHAIPNNQHFNAYGQGLLAGFCQAAIPSNWLGGIASF